MIKNLSKIILISAFLVVNISATEKNVETIRERNIDKLLQISGVDKIKDSMIVTIKKMYPNDIEVERFLTSYFDKTMDMMRPIFSKYYTDEEIQYMVNFYESDIGKKIIEKQPLIMQEIIMQAQKNAKELVREIEEMKKVKQ